MTAALFAGDISFDSTVVVPHVPGPDEKVLATRLVEDAGGVVANAAIACALAGQAATLLCATGNDAAAERCASSVESRGVPLSRAARAGSTVRALIVLDAGGEKRLMLSPGVSMYPAKEQCRDVPLDHVCWLHTALYAPEAAQVLIGRCRRRSVPFSIDLEPATLARGLVAVEPCIDGAETVFVNTRAAALLGARPERVLFAAGARAVVLTSGPEGATWCTPDEQTSVRAPALPHGTIDSTGAGDCLAGSFVARRISGAAAPAALRYAVAAASLSCTRVGGQASYPQPAQVAALLATSTEGAHTP
jgi:ribokinase